MIQGVHHKMLKTAIGYCTDVAAYQTKLETLFLAETYPRYIYYDDVALEYKLSNVHRMPICWNPGETEFFALLKIYQFDEFGDPAGLIADLSPEITILQHGTNRSVSDSPWDKLSVGEWTTLDGIVTNPNPETAYGECATAIVS